ncbi:MAG: hypothetical protein RLZZ271_1149, partial [Pseudomonadota bacterium]
MSAVKIFVPRDSAALAVGADEVAQAIAREAAQRGIALDLVRNGSRGLFWLEPLVEVQTPQGRVAFGPVSESDVPGLFDSEMLGASVNVPVRAEPVEAQHTQTLRQAQGERFETKQSAPKVQGASHPLYLGLTEQIPYLAKQERLTFARMGVTDPLSLTDYEAHGGWAGLRRAVQMLHDGSAAIHSAVGSSGSPAIVQEVLDSGLRGRGGAAFPTGIKWRTVMQAQSAQKYVVCN